jgi:hypothetical protein
MWVGGAHGIAGGVALSYKKALLDWDASNITTSGPEPKYF